MFTLGLSICMKSFEQKTFAIKRNVLMKSQLLSQLKYSHGIFPMIVNHALKVIPKRRLMTMDGVTSKQKIYPKR